MRIVHAKLELPLTLSHYTTLEGLKGIIASRGLWASNAAFLNDKAELSHALRAAKAAITRLSSVKTMKQWSPMLKKVISEFEDSGIPDTYVACFCSDHDNLSQWRGYGGSIHGVSLTFNRKKLTERLKSSEAELLKVRYTKLSTVDKLSTALSDEITRIADLDELVQQLTDEARHKELRSRVSALLPRFKHLGFQDEREYRYVVQRVLPSEEIRFRVSNNKIVPYIEVGASNEPLPIEAARIGPGPDQELTMRSVKLFLHNKGYEVPVTMSEVPFRT